MNVFRKISMIFALSALVLAGAGYAGFSHAAEAAKTAEEKPAAAAPAAPGVNWAERCQDVKKSETETVKYCEVFQRLSVKQKDSENLQRVAELAVGYPDGPKEKARGVLILPLGILVEEPVQLDIDGKKAFTSRTSYCQPDGCYGLLTLSDSAVDKLGKGKALTVKLKAVGGQQIQFDMVLEGFKDAIGKIGKS